MISSELDAAGVHDVALRESYQKCRAINAQHGRTFFLATRLLSPEQRPAVHALYGFARRADDVLDQFDSRTPAERAGELQGLSTALFTRMVENQPSGDDPTLDAVVHTARKYDLDWQLFDDFLTSMRMDLTVTDYPDRAALDRYMYGSAEVIGLQMLPILGTVVPREEAAPHAAALGKAFQLTNFLRDIDEDLTRGRVYLPADELAVHGVDRDVLTWCQKNRRTDQRLRAALVEQLAITRTIYRSAEPGIAMLAPKSRPCISAALTLYSGILKRIEDIDYAVFAQRATVSIPRRLRVASVGLAKALLARARRREV
ncbi:phytoene/squalene synthase family protein [Mycolicibacterium sp. BiH015]|uniref:phytoene/squalene synthase family protein n=1 Tax=Mycolicibacterium sp. BiH015 TaxID=3018808 RepID=UPI0022E2413A|nr:phytoene/squalene synthase family protein [Mycolicibacterium sp. BiH015]MDA2894184.1 phytoene/squalene synthase family protein [Mycolicibacterium sp. BiH015]